MSLFNLPNHPFLADASGTVCAVRANNRSGFQRLFPVNYRTSESRSVVAPATTFGASTYDGNGGLVRINGAGAHGLTVAVSPNRWVFITWTGGMGVSQFYQLSSFADAGSTLTINLPFVGAAVTFGVSASAVTFSTYAATNPKPTEVTWTGHGLTEGRAVIFETAGTLPAGIVAGTTYFVAKVLTANVFTIAAAAGGLEIVATSNGTSTHTGRITPTVVTWTGHGRSIGDQVRLTTSSALPTGFSINTTYFVRDVLGPNTLTLSATAGGAPIAASATGTGPHAALLWYGTPAVTQAGTAMTLATVNLAPNDVTRGGRIEVDVLASAFNSANNKVLTLAYAGTTIWTATYTNNAICANINKVLVPTGDAELRTSATSMTGHGISTNAVVTVAANYQTASTAMVLTANLATANEPLVLDYMDLDAE
jgi:hypothetical protein